MKLDEEQREMLRENERVQGQYKGRGWNWNRFRGMATLNLVAYYLEKHLPEDVKLIRSAWVEGCPNELDLLIVDKDAKPIGFTPAYPKDRVRCIIEVKAAGVYWKRSEVKRNLQDYFGKVKKETGGKPFLYLTLWEGFKVAELTKETLKEDAFILESGTPGRKEFKSGEWARFINKLHIRNA